MRIRFLVLSLLVLCLAVSGCQQAQEPAVKVGVVDMNRLLRDSEPGKEASRFLEGMQKEIQQQIDDVQARLGKDPENEALQRELQAIYMGGQQRINAENLEETLRVQREEAQRAQRMATETANIGAFQLEKQAEVGVVGANALGQMGTSGATEMGGGSGGGVTFTPVAFLYVINGFV